MGCESFIKYLKKNLARYGSLNLEWFGGEPLLAPEIIEKVSAPAIEMCQKLGIPFRAGITTNGYLLTPEIMKRMIKCRIRAYSITIDGTESCHDQMRQLRNGEGTFQRIISNLTKIKNEIHSGTFEILIRTNVTQSLLPCFDEYIHMLQKNFGDDRRFTFYFRPAGNWGGERAEKIEHSFVNTLDEIYQPILNATSILNYDGNV